MTKPLKLAGPGTVLNSDCLIDGVTFDKPTRAKPATPAQKVYLAWFDRYVRDWRNDGREIGLAACHKATTLEVVKAEAPAKREAA